MKDRFTMDAVKRIGNCRDIEHMIHFDGGNDRLDISLKFDAESHPNMSIPISLFVDKTTGFAELWVFEEKVWTETEAYS